MLLVAERVKIRSVNCLQSNSFDPLCSSISAHWLFGNLVGTLAHPAQPFLLNTALQQGCVQVCSKSNKCHSGMKERTISFFLPVCSLMKVTAKESLAGSKVDGLLATLLSSTPFPLRPRRSVVWFSLVISFKCNGKTEKKSRGANLFPPSSAPAGYWGESEREQEKHFASKLPCIRSHPLIHNLCTQTETNERSSQGAAERHNRNHFRLENSPVFTRPKYWTAITP